MRFAFERSMCQRQGGSPRRATGAWMGSSLLTGVGVAAGLGLVLGRGALGSPGDATRPRPLNSDATVDVDEGSSKSGWGAGRAPPPPPPSSFTFWVHTCADTEGMSLVDPAPGTARWAGCRSIPLEVNRTTASEENLLQQLMARSHGHYVASDRRMLREAFLKMLETWRLSTRSSDAAVADEGTWHTAEEQVGRQDVEADPTVEAVELDLWWLQMLPIGGWANTYEPVTVMVKRSGGAVAAVERICDTYYCVLPPYVKAWPAKDREIKGEGRDSVERGERPLSGRTLRDALLVLVHEWMKCITAAGQTPVGAHRDDPTKIVRELNALMGACAEQFRASAYPLLGKGILTRVVDFHALRKPVGYSSLTVVEAGEGRNGTGTHQVTRPLPLYEGEFSIDVVTRVCSTIMSCNARARDTLLHFFSGKLGEEPRSAKDQTDTSSLFEWVRIHDPHRIDLLLDSHIAIPANAREDQAFALAEAACRASERNLECADEAALLALEWHVRRKLRHLETIRLPFHSGIRGHRNIALSFNVTQADTPVHMATMLCLPADMGCTTEAKRGLIRLFGRFLDLRSYTVRLRVPWASETFLAAFSPPSSGIETVSMDGLVDWPIFFNDDTASVADEIIRAATAPLGGEFLEGYGSKEADLRPVLEEALSRLKVRYEKMYVHMRGEWDPHTNYSIVSPAQGFQAQAFLAALNELGAISHPLDVVYSPGSNLVLHKGRHTYGPIYPRSFLLEACRQRGSQGREGFPPSRDPSNDTVLLFQTSLDPPPPRPIDFAWVGLSDELWESPPLRIAGLAGYSSWIGQIGGSGMREHGEPDAKVLGIYARANFTFVSSTPELIGESNARRTGRSGNAWHFSFIEAVLMGSIPVLFEDEAASLPNFLDGYEFITATAASDGKQGMTRVAVDACDIPSPNEMGTTKHGEIFIAGPDSARRGTKSDGNSGYSLNLSGLDYSWELARRNLMKALDRHFFFLSAEQKNDVLSGTCHEGKWEGNAA